MRSPAVSCVHTYIRTYIYYITFAVARASLTISGTLLQSRALRLYVHFLSFPFPFPFLLRLPFPLCCRCRSGQFLHERAGHTSYSEIDCAVLARVTIAPLPHGQLHRLMPSPDLASRALSGRRLPNCNVLARGVAWRSCRVQSPIACCQASIPRGRTGEWRGQRNAPRVQLGKRHAEPSCRPALLATCHTHRRETVTMTAAR